MKLVKVERDGRCAEGVLIDEQVHVVGEWRPGPADKAAFTLGAKALPELQSLLEASKDRAALSDVVLAVPVDPMAQIFCAGFNYRAHLTEIKADEPTNPVIFKRTLDTLVAHGQPIVRPKVSETLDYEGEIAIVIGRDARYVPVDQAMSYISGYSCFMDGSVREYQKHSVTSGKNFWHTGSMGPWIVTPDEVGSRDMELESYVNAEQRQSSTASRMIFDIATLIAYCSTLTWLRPGDVIATGTPGGVGSRMTPQCWLKPGDTVEVKIGGVGELKNPVIEDPHAAAA